MPTPYRVLARLREGARLGREDLEAVARGATDGSWADAQLGAFLMAVALEGLSVEETQLLTRSMLESGDQWKLVDDIPLLADKHSTGGVGDKVSLLLSPIYAATGRPVAMLTGRGLGHTGGTADKLESIRGLDLALDRGRAVRLVEETGLAIGMATSDVAPADRKLYSLRDVTATIDSLPLITASILSKKLATGTAGIVFDVKAGSGAFLRELSAARALAEMLVSTSSGLGTPASALVTDMSQPLGRWIGHASEVHETLACLAGDGPDDLMEVTYALCVEMARLIGQPAAEDDFRAVVDSGEAHELFERWARAQGAESGWQEADELALAPVEQVIEAPRAGFLAAVDARELGLLLVEAGGGRRQPGDEIDHGIALHSTARLGQRLERGDELLRLYERREEAGLVERFAACFTLSDEKPSVPPLIYEKVELSEEDSGERPEEGR